MTTVNRVAKGRRPVYFNDPAVDKLMAILLSVIEELSSCRDRIDALERLLESRGVVEQEDVENYQPDSVAEAERSARREAYIGRVMRVVTMELQRTDDSGATGDFSDALKTMMKEDEASSSN